VERLRQAGDVDVGLAGVDLATERVAADRDVDPADGLLTLRAALDPVGQEDHARAGPERRHAGTDALPKRLQQVEGHRQLVHGGGLAPGHDQGVDALQLARPAHQHRSGAE
jgi:hypothetical protein